MGLVCLGAATGLRENLSSFMYLFFWELPEYTLRWFALASPPAYILAFILTARMHARFDKRETLIGAMILIAAMAVFPVGCRFLGIFPENGDPGLFPLLMLGVFLFYCGVAVLTITVMSALADVADQHEIETHRRQEGIFYSARTFFGKLTTALGLFLAGVGLDVIGFEAQSVPGEVSADVLVGLGVLDAIVPFIPAAVAIFFYGSYRIDKQKHADIRAELDQRRAAEGTMG